MRIEYREAVQDDAELLISLYNSTYYDDFLRYGECPAYGRSTEDMEKSISENPKEIILCDGIPAGVISVQDKGKGNYYLGCLCIVPEYQGKSLGTDAFAHALKSRPDWQRIDFVTPADKEQNLRFYIDKCGCSTGKYTQDDNVKLIELFRTRA